MSRIDSKTALYGVIGNPISHSLSPVMHNAAIHAAGINAAYMAFLIRQEHISDFLHSAEILGLRGINVTLPYKTAFLSQVNQITERAAFLNSINTLWKEDTGWHGDSTDGKGFIRSLQESSVDVLGAEVLLLGAGGAAKPIAYSLGEAGAKSVYIVNRTASKAQNLVEKLNPEFPNTQFFADFPANNIEILINSTSVGLNKPELPVAPEWIQKSETVVDIIYSPPETLLLKTAAEYSKKCVNGLGMLIHQGAISFEIWFGQAPDTDLMKKSLQSVLNK